MFTRLLVLALCCAIAPRSQAISARPESTKTDLHRGYYWYQTPVKPESESAKNPKEDAEVPSKPLSPPPPREAMMKMHPLRIKKMLDDYLQNAIWQLTPESVVDYYNVQDVARRKAAAFAAVSQMVMLEHPELNAASQYPTNNPGQEAELKTRNNEIQKTLADLRADYALAMFSRPGCPYCLAQWNILKFVHDKDGLEIVDMNIEEHPELKARFNISVTPMVILIERDSENWMPVAVGVESVPNIEANTYRAVRYLRGEIKPEQFLTDGHQEGGFFDPNLSPRSVP